MSYTAEVSRSNPACILFLLDQSASMLENWGGETGKQKADGVATIINRFLHNLVLKCTKSEGVRDYFHVGILTYGNEVRSGFSGALAGRDLVPISEIAETPLRIERRTRLMDDGAGGLITRTVRAPVWFDPVARGGTFMCSALSMAEAIVRKWLDEHPDCHPPIVINITDGEPFDGDPIPMAQRVRQLGSSQGTVLLLNVHISSSAKLPIQYPDHQQWLPDQFAKLLFEMSSPLPDYMVMMAHEMHIPVKSGARGFAFNADMVSLVSFLDVGTRIADSSLVL